MNEFIMRQQHHNRPHHCSNLDTKVMSLDGSLDLETMQKERLVWKHNQVRDGDGSSVVEEGKKYRIGARQILTLLVA